MSTSPTKAELRAEIRRRVAALPPRRRAADDEQIRQRIIELHHYETARQILAFLPMEDEPDIAPLLVRACDEGRRVYAPLVGGSARLRFVRWLPADGLCTRSGAWTASSTEAPRDDASIVLVPARAIDAEGHRLGRGRGCYDRSMSELRALGPTVGVIYDCQLLDTLPHEEHDAPVDYAVTESRLVCRAERRL